MICFLPFHFPPSPSPKMGNLSTVTVSYWSLNSGLLARDLYLVQSTVHSRWLINSYWNRKEMRTEEVLCEQSNARTSSLATFWKRCHSNRSLTNREGESAFSNRGSYMTSWAERALWVVVEVQKSGFGGGGLFCSLTCTDSLFVPPIPWEVREWRCRMTLGTVWPDPALTFICSSCLAVFLSQTQVQALGLSQRSRYWRRFLSSLQIGNGIAGGGSGFHRDREVCRERRWSRKCLWTFFVEYLLCLPMSYFQTPPAGWGVPQKKSLSDVRG